jgi:hypothetical protein
MRTLFFVLLALLVGAACGSSPGSPAPSAPRASASSGASVGAGQAPLDSFFLEEREVDRATFDARLAKLDVDREPWKTRVTVETEATHGFTAIFEAVDRATGERWTYLEVSHGSGARRSSRQLTRGSGKPQPAPAP